MSWENKKLIDIATFLNGMAFKPSDWSDNGVPIIRILQINKPDLIDNCYKGYINPQYVVHYGDLLFSWSATLTTIIWKSFTGVLNQHIYKVLPIGENDLRYIHYILDFNISELAKQSHGSTMQHVTKKDLDKFSTFISTDPKEQKKIADILESVDNSIESTQKAIEKYKLVKQGMMQDLLTRGLDKSGKLRPTYEQAPEIYKESKLGFIPKEWAEKTWSDVMPLQRGFDLPNNNLTKGIYPVGYSNGVLNYHNEYRVKAPCVWTGRSGTIGKVFYQNENCWAHNTTLWVTNFCGNNPKFIYYLLCSIELTRYNAGTGVPTLNRNDLHSKTLSIPQNEKEQQQIADRLTSIDNKIEAEQTYLEKLEKIKQGLMQDLLTGKVRCKF